MKTITTSSTGESVRLCQERLVAHGFGPLDLSGSFGSRTRAAVVQFQQASGLKADGIVGDRTWDALMVERRVAAPESVLEEQIDWLVEQIPPGVQPAVVAVLDAAISMLGEREEPAGSNWSPKLAPVVDGYYSAADEKRLGRPPWCALFVSWAIRRGLGSPSWAATPMGARFGGAAQFLDWGKRTRRVEVVPTAGCIFVMARDGSGSDAGAANAGHCGLVVAVDVEKIVTVEGNTSNSVASRRRSRADVLGFVRWW